MEYLFGVKANDFVLLAADKSVFRSIFTITQEDDKLYSLGEKVAMVCVGEGGDAPQFAEYIEKNAQLYKISNGYELSPKAVANFTRRTLAESLRSRSPYFVHLIIGGWDEVDQKPYLSYMDYLATEFRSPFVMHGHGSRFCYSIMDREYKPDMTQTEAIDALKKCVAELKSRFILNYNEFQVISVSKDGIRKLDPIKFE